MAPEADIISIRVADSNGSVIESELIVAIQELADWIASDSKNKVDVLNLSLGYYHETPEDGRFSLDLYKALSRIRAAGCVVVCSAGNDATDRPTFPAALHEKADAELNLGADARLAPHHAVGALNPQRTSVALFSNIGHWVTCFAPGTSVVSIFPDLRGGVQPGSKADLYERRRQSLDPDDYSGGFAIWSGTSFAAPYVAATIAKKRGALLMEGKAAVAKSLAVNPGLAQKLSADPTLAETLAAEAATAAALEDVGDLDESSKKAGPKSASGGGGAA